MKKLFFYTLMTVLIFGGASQALADNHDDDYDKAAMFEMLDSDGDGTVSREEFAKKRAEHKKEKRNKMVEEIDSDGDGVISEDEFISKSRERFSKLDADKDGKVTQDEAHAHRDAMKEKRGERREKIKERRKDRRLNKAAE